MAQAAGEIRSMTIAEYDAFVAGIASDGDLELAGSELVMMVNPTEMREQATHGVFGELA